MSVMSGCPGAASLKGAQKITVKICPECGKEIEIFSRDTHVICECGFIAYNNAQSCIKWCKHALECVGVEVYDRIISND
jgi:hypothetical protein